jgi:hypothetical protein
MREVVSGIFQAKNHYCSIETLCNRTDVSFFGIAKPMGSALPFQPHQIMPL